VSVDITRADRTPPSAVDYLDGFREPSSTRHSATLAGELSYLVPVISADGLLSPYPDSWCVNIAGYLRYELPAES
jgi:hypothetical protein